ncbi:MAG: hypothetical protein HOV80_33490 [Polyangiaceae bacterium]|nr:hypothetical protein [Polyangiaceae bacterium]
MANPSRIFMLGLICALSVACGDDKDTEDDGSTATTGAGVTTSNSGSTSSGTGAGGEGGGGPEPIEGPEDEWAWRPIQGTLCGNGSTAGVGVNLHEGSTDLIIVVSGGGACWDDEMCNGAAPASVHLHEELTEGIVAPELPVVDRSDPNNPLSTATWAYVPYCTGDLHWGDQRTEYASGAIEHRGASNLRTFLERLRATRPETQRILLIGGSAGGYGVTFHWGTAKDVFGDIEVHVLADAAPMVRPQGTRYADMLAAWSPEFPAGCTECADDPGFLIDALADAHPTSRHGLMIYDNDAVISQYFGFEGALAAAIATLRTTHHDPHDLTKVFVVPGTDHGVLGDDVAGSDGSTATEFFVAWLLGDASWHSTP